VACLLIAKSTTATGVEVKRAHVGDASCVGKAEHPCQVPQRVLVKSSALLPLACTQEKSWA